LAFAVAINIEPEILIVDEALSVGDVFFQAKCYRKFEEFKKMGKTILFVSHDLSSISKYCDRAILLNKGLKLDEGKPAEMIDLFKKVQVGLLDDDTNPQMETTPAEEEKAETVQEEENVIWKNQMTLNPKAQDYGERDAEIIDFAVMDDSGKISNVINKGSFFKIVMKVKFHKKESNPIFAFTIKDIRGTDITGTNTMLEKIDIPDCQEGDVRVVTFRQKMELQAADYLLSLGCTTFHGDDFVVYHRLYDICNIAVIASKNSVGFYDRESEITVR
jgi:teichoic acid transport system ATP-binding protein